LKTIHLFLNLYILVFMLLDFLGVLAPWRLGGSIPVFLGGLGG
jgi:hypothetical protein